MMFGTICLINHIVLMEGGGMNKEDKDQNAKELSQFCLKLTELVKNKEKVGEVVTRMILPAVVVALGDASINRGGYWDSPD
jgi:hypothetical protein